MSAASYDNLLAQEAEAWNRAAEELASASPPDWRYRRDLPGLPEYSIRQIDALLDRAKPGMRALELGCGSGWLTLALAQRGATAHGIDVAHRAVEIGRAYLQMIEPEVSGRVTYHVADLNHIDLAPASVDLVVANGLLHHLIDPRGMIDRVHQALAPGGLLWVSDKYGHEAPSTVLLASILMAVLPTQVSSATSSEVCYASERMLLRAFGRACKPKVYLLLRAPGAGKTGPNASKASSRWRT